MTTVKFQGNPVKLKNTLVKVGDSLPNFVGVDGELKEVDLASLRGQKLVINFAPSLDTPTCQQQLREFSKRAANSNAKVIFITADLPFAQGRFCEQEGIEDVVTLSDFRHKHAVNFGLEIADTFLAGLCARAVIVTDENLTVQHVELVDEIAEEPNYDNIKL